MKVLIDIGHPAHVHFFSHPIKKWQQAGHKVIVSSRYKEIATDLLDALKVEHHVLSAMNKGSVGGMALELLVRDLALFKLVRSEKPDILTGIGGIFVAHVGFVSRTPSIVFYDTENATLSNLITYPFCSMVVVPSCYQKWLPPWHLRYPGYHELSYLHPNRFTPDKKKAISCGLHPEKLNFLIRVVSWQASHDVTEKGWNIDLLRQVTNYLAARGNVLISSEGELPKDLLAFRYTGPPEDIHHLMAYLNLFIGESATMASECVALGIPAIYAAHSSRGYMDEQERRYGMAVHLKNLHWPVIEKTIAGILEIAPSVWQDKQAQLLAEKIDVAEFVCQFVEKYPQSINTYKAQFANIG
ncbi:DUF354 domain-containing protein [Desulfogranum japonicum]|uniref:DUF354 domain-containing protein n=1 Tax=Desulfogranum japonicum TaxID=231447 RepID=UPI0004154622|nr:DUF354 domain-containing protein [Desulfogranum japonicum]